VVDFTLSTRGASACGPPPSRASQPGVCRFPTQSVVRAASLSCNISCVLRYGCPEAAVAEGAAPCTLQLCTFMYNTHVLKVTWKVTWVCPAPHCHLSHRQRTTHPCAPCPCTNREGLIGAARGFMSQSPPSHPKRRDPQVEPGRLSAARRLAAPRAAASGNSVEHRSLAGCSMHNLGSGQRVAARARWRGRAS
jgi:hypothetical protein